MATSEDVMGRACAKELLTQAISDLNEQEILVIADLALRLAKGKEQYGGLDLAADKRNFRMERKEEIEDVLIYSCFIALKELFSS